MENNLYETGIRLWTEWTNMWNGRPELALELVAPRFRLHLPTPLEEDELAIDTPEAVRQLVIRARAKVELLQFHFPIGPFVDVRAGVVAGPWHADVVAGGVKRIASGMDTIFFRDGKI